ncbi:SUN domain protein [Aspergillus avenaceus]|uniref:SUN domain protein n=1 Tax=Aspergillus avenaceus TaxID=36643 RepID=A0A5N6TV86_ASPAV|nr:SUN domain protein [Aspergillus avenaceus]
MKFNSVALTLATAGSLVAAQHHQHRHHHKRTVDTQVVSVNGESTVIKYELNGKEVTADFVCAQVKEGKLKYADGQPAVDACQSSVTPSSSSTQAAAAAPTQAPAEFVETSSAPATPTSSSASSSSASSTASSSSASSTAKGLNVDFPDGEIDCDQFPSDYGPIALDYLGLGGWSGIQYVSVADKVVSHISTAVKGDGCTSGSMCSYACPPGYQKSQWPSTQGSTGQSVGGLECRSGKLYLTNSALSKKLCIEGVGGVHVQNNIGSEIAVCRTDYPGTESETIPLALGNNDLQPLTCPNGETYFKWQGKVTSAQYYVNPKGYSTKEGCNWGDGSKPIGNWAPINLGVGENNGKWLSIFQNSPTTTEKLDFNIKIKGDNLGGSCKYENGKFYSESGSNDSGCTVQVKSGDATYVFY